MSLLAARHAGRTGRHAYTAASGAGSPVKSGRKVRRLLALGYQPFQVALFLSFHGDDVRDFVRRLTPIRRSVLKRPRERSQQLAIRPTLPRFIPPALEPIADDWSYRARPDELPAAAPIAAAVDDQVGDELRTIAHKCDGRPTTAQTAWVGPETPRLHDPKLAGDQIDRAREMLMAGDSYPVVAKRFDVSVNTLRKYVGDVGRRRSVPTYPTSAVTYPHGVVPLGPSACQVPSYPKSGSTAIAAAASSSRHI